MHDQLTMNARPVGVTAELGAIAERRARAIDLWDGPIQDAWGALLWYQDQSRRLAERLAERHDPALAGAWLRCQDAADKIIELIGRREAEARAEVRGMDPFIAWARQNSRIDAHLADQWRLQAAGLERADLLGVA